MRVSGVCWLIWVALIVVSIAPCASAGVAVLSKSINLIAEIDEGDGGSDTASSSDFTTFSDSVSVGSASGSATCSDLGDGVSFVGSCQQQSGGEGLRVETLLNFSLSFEVTDTPAPYSLVADFTQSFSGDTASSKSFVQFGQFIGEGLCDGFNGCASLSVNESGELQPGMYFLIVQTRTRVLPAGTTASLAGSWSFQAGDACQLAWADPAGGDFSDAENWSPAQAPVDDGDGCANVVFDTPGTYGVTLGDAAANSLLVLSGEPSLLGGALVLSGQDQEQALGVRNGGRLTIESGTVTTASAGVGLADAGGVKGLEAPGFLRIRPGVKLTVNGLFEVGRDPLGAGELVLGDGANLAVIEVNGDAVLGNFGTTQAFGNGEALVDVSGGLTLGRFLAGEGTMSLNGSVADIRLMELKVGGTLALGLGGKGVLSLGEATTGESATLMLGQFTDAEGILNLSGAACTTSVTGTATVGAAGNGTLSITGGATLSAADLLLGTEAGGSGALELSGEDSTLDVSGDLILGGAGSARADVSNGGTLKAGILRVDSTAEDGALLTVDGSTAPAKVDAGALLAVAVSGPAGLAMNGQATVTTIDLSMGLLAGSDTLSLWLGDADADGIDDRTVSVQAAGNAMIGLEGTAQVVSIGAADHQFGELWLGVNTNGKGSYQTSGAFAFTKVSGEVEVGIQGSGELEIDAGGLFAGACTLGVEPGGLGVARVSGGAGLLIGPLSSPSPAKGAEASGFLQVGRKSNGLLELFDADSRVQCAEAIVGGDNPAAGGTVNIDSGAKLECFGSMTLGAASGPALMRVANGATLDIGIFLIVGPQARAIVGLGANCQAGSVFIEGRVEIVSEVAIERTTGKIAKGAPGPVIFDGDLQMTPTGTLSVTVGAALQVTGAATLDGTLEIVLPPGTDFVDGQLVDLLEFAGGVTGDFDAITFINAPDGFDATIAIEDGILRMLVSHGGTATGEGEGEDGVQSADQDGDFVISLSELLRVIQFYNSLGYHCSDNPGDNEDGYVSGPGANQTCSPYDTDYNLQDWVISLSELLRVVQFYNSLGYRYCPADGTEDGFCPGQV